VQQIHETKMNHCLNCGKEVKNKYCNIGCQNIHLAAKRTDKRFGEKKVFIVQCFKCGESINIIEREKLYPNSYLHHDS